MKLKCIKNTIIKKKLFGEKIVNLPFTRDKIYHVFYDGANYGTTPHILVYTDNKTWEEFSWRILNHFIPVED